MKNTIDILDVVALTEDLPEHGLYRVQVSTAVKSLDTSIFKVEFCSHFPVAFKVVVPYDQ